MLLRSSTDVAEVSEAEKCASRTLSVDDSASWHQVLEFNKTGDVGLVGESQRARDEADTVDEPSNCMFAP